MRGGFQVPAMAEAVSSQAATGADSFCSRSNRSPASSARVSQRQPESARISQNQPKSARVSQSCSGTCQQRQALQLRLLALIPPHHLPLQKLLSLGWVHAIHRHHLGAAAVGGLCGKGRDGARGQERISGPLPCWQHARPQGGQQGGCAGASGACHSQRRGRCRRWPRTPHARAPCPPMSAYQRGCHCYCCCCACGTQAPVQAGCCWHFAACGFTWT